MEQSLSIRLYRKDDTNLQLIDIPHQSLQLHNLFCRVLNLEDDLFYYEGEDGRVRVDNTVEFEVFVSLLLQNEQMDVYEELEDDFDINPIEGHSNNISTFLIPGDFARIGVLGQGASGTCYKAVNMKSKCKNMNIGDIVAIKSIESVDEEMIQEQLKREIATLKKCESCEYIVRLLGQMEDDSVKMLVFEYMDGGSLERYGILHPRVLSVVATSLLNALIFLTTKGIIHRDIKRSNVLVSLSGEIKLSDMGVSRVLPPNILSVDSYVGDNYYMPPERLLGKPYSTSAEIWGLAVLLCECSIGRHPFVLDNECIKKVHMRVVERVKTSCAFIQYIPIEHGYDFIHMIECNTHYNSSNRWNLVKLCECSYMNRSREVDRDEAAQWFNHHFNVYNDS